ncbi:MAG: hypothetical protein J5654_00595 [Victivallales bacterium]|nr:hypothetical protein [Victivallales bacterium]
MKVICINVEDLSLRTVTLRHPKGCSAAPDTCWRFERLFNVDEESGEFFTLTRDNNNKHCYINVYSRDGIFIQQYKRPNFIDRFPGSTLMFGDELLSDGELLGGELGMLFGVVRLQLTSYNFKIGQKRIVFPNTSKRMEIYSLNRYNSEIAIINVRRTGDINFENSSISDIEELNNDEEQIFLYNVRKNEMTEIKFPTNWESFMHKGTCAEKSLLWFGAIENDANHDYVDGHLLEARPDGSATEVTGLPGQIHGTDIQTDDPDDHVFITNMVIRRDNPDEYVYICHQTRKGAPHGGFNADKEFLCGYFPDSGKEMRTVLKLGGRSAGVSALTEYASDDRIGLLLHKLDPSSYWELLFTLPPRHRYQIYDKDLNLLKSFVLPWSSAENLQVGKVFYQVYY